MTLARLLQPSMVVIEDVDLIARDRTTMGSPCEEVLLNKLLNEMDGLRPDADDPVRPDDEPARGAGGGAGVAAGAGRPGDRVPAARRGGPGEAGAALRPGRGGAGGGASGETVKRTEGVSASFIKELMRRSAQFHLERGGSGSSAWRTWRRRWTSCSSAAARSIGSCSGAGPDEVGPSCQPR